MSAREDCLHCWLEAVRTRLLELERENFRGVADEPLNAAVEAWCEADLKGVALATRRAEELIAQGVCQ